jgi:hypothetical protein
MAKTFKGIRKALEKEIERSLLMDVEEKTYWLAEIGGYPEVLIAHFLDIMKKNNGLADRYIERAIEKNPALVEKFRERVRKLKKQIDALKEKEDFSRVKAEDLLEKELEET